MGARLNRLTHSHVKAPGAGTYNPPSKIIESPGKSFSKRLHTSHFAGDLGSGPGGYNADKQKSDNFGYSMAAKLEDLAFKTRNFQPGPGTHTPRRHDGSPRTKFGSGQKCRLEGEKEFRQKPGPGAYE